MRLGRADRMRAGITALILSLIAGLSASKPIDFTDKTVDCSDPNGYSVVEVRDPAVNYVNIEQGGMVLWSIKFAYRDGPQRVRF